LGSLVPRPNRAIRKNPGARAREEDPFFSGINEYGADRWGTIGDALLGRGMSVRVSTVIDLARAVCPVVA
jgi:hypothetical protein